MAYDPNASCLSFPKKISAGNGSCHGACQQQLNHHFFNFEFLLRWINNHNQPHMISHIHAASYRGDFKVLAFAFCLFVWLDGFLVTEKNHPCQTKTAWPEIPLTRHFWSKRVLDVDVNHIGRQIHHGTRHRNHLHKKHPHHVPPKTRKVPVGPRDKFWICRGTNDMTCSRTANKKHVR